MTLFLANILLSKRCWIILPRRIVTGDVTSSVSCLRTVEHAGVHQEKQIDFCYQCDQFPCKKTNFDPDLYNRWVIIDEKIRVVGIEAYCKAARVRSRYP